MIVFPHAKINLGLNVVRKRPDGYHDIQSVLMPIPLCDAMEAVVDPELAEGQVVFSRSGLAIPGDEEQNLCLKAVRAIGSTWKLPGLRLHLNKVIPMGAGLGGGSSDGAHMLMLLNDVVGLGLSGNELHGLAMELGSDCPFFLRRGAQVATGRGEELEPIKLDLEGLWLVLVNPGEHVSTADVYRNTPPSGVDIDLAAILSTGDPENWRGYLHNAMEPFVVASHPTVGSIKQRLLGEGAAYAAMSGSGSTVFGLFRQAPPQFNWPDRYRAWVYRC